MMDSYSITAAAPRGVIQRVFARLRAAAAMTLLLLAIPALAQEAPDALVKRVSQEALQIIKTDPKVQAGDQPQRPRGQHLVEPGTHRTRHLHTDPTLDCRHGSPNCYFSRCGNQNLLCEIVDVTQ